jgi:hypothetical protein
LDLDVSNNTQESGQKETCGTAFHKELKRTTSEAKCMPKIDIRDEPRSEVLYGGEFSGRGLYYPP